MRLTKPKPKFVSTARAGRAGDNDKESGFSSYCETAEFDINVTNGEAVDATSQIAIFSDIRRTSRYMWREAAGCSVSLHHEYEVERSAILFEPEVSLPPYSRSYGARVDQKDTGRMFRFRDLRVSLISSSSVGIKVVINVGCMSHDCIK